VNSRDCSRCTDESRRRMVLGLLSVPLAIVQTSAARAAPDQPVAHLSDLAQPWSAVKFTLPDADGSDMPCIVVRLPGDKWYASSLICPHNKCTIMYVPDVNMARDSFNVETSTPVLACPCHFSVFDPAQNGRVIGGPAPNPPLQLRIEVRGNDIFVNH
jgi:arsenite oxidase small subunit